MGKLRVTHDDESYVLDEFYKSMMFQQIMDGDFSRDERDMLLVISRKTIHYNKWYDRLGIYWLSQAVGIGHNKTRQIIRQLEAKGLIEVEHSKGGRTESNKRFSKFALANDLVFLVVRKWIEVKEDNGFYLE